MLLNQLVEVNQKGLVARAVSFSLMDVPDKNLKLCEGFVFNHDSDANRAKNTTVGILHAIRHSFHSASKPNVHLIVQDYGKGKSHFALTVANFFKHPYSSDEVQGILAQLRSAAGENSYVYEDLLAYKKLGNHLVLCLSAEDVIDMRKHFFKVLNQELEKHGITDTISQQNCREPLNFLQKLDGGEQNKAETYLKTNFSTTLADIKRRLSENDFKAVSIAKDICIHVKGVTPDFSGEIPIKDTIDELIANYCGSGKRFNGILILFDELYEYLQKWTADPIGAGGLFLQSITQACQDHSSKIALVCLTQKRPLSIRPPKNGEDYNRIASRIETPSTYNPKASLELVLDGLLEQPLDSAIWQNFEKRYGGELKRKSEDVFSKYAEEYYRGINWKHNDFYNHLTIGCFPLHPLTSYLLCNLSFTQGRSAIDFVQKEVEEFIRDRQVEENGKLNFIYPISLVDAFKGNFANPEANTEYTAVFSDYNYSLNKVNASSDSNPDEVAVLKALLLFYTSRGQLKKSDKEKHEEILQTLTGLSTIRITEAIEKLCKVREVIYLNLADNTYKFYGGGKGIDDLRQRVREEAKHRNLSIVDVEQHLNDNVGVYTKGKGTTIPQQFVDVKKLRTEDWYFQNKVFSVKNLRSLLQKNQPFKTPDQSGIVAYVIAETSEEILMLEKDITKMIEKHSYRDQFAVAIAERPIEELAKLMLEQQVADKFKPQEFGAALSQIKGQYIKQIENEINEVFGSVKYYSHILEDIPQGDKNNISIIVSEILEKSYSLIPPIEGNDKLYLKSAKGSSGNAFIAKRILEDDLRPESLETAYKGIVEVYLKSWGLLRFSLKTKKYEVTIPNQKDVRKAWDKISELTALGEQSERITQLYQVWEILSSPPYGYNAYTFTILLTSWLAYHRSEVLLEGSFGIPQKKSEQVRSKIEPIKSWVSTNILDKPKEFISEWIIKHRPRIVRRKPSVAPVISETYTYDLAKQKCEEISDFIATSGTPDKYQSLVEHQQSLAIACSRIEQSFAPVIEIEELIESRSINSWADVSEFIDLYSDLQNPLINFAENGLTVICTTEQASRYKQAKNSALEKINEAIAIEGDRHTQLETEEACGIHKANLTQAINQLNQIENIPPRFLQVLEKSLSSTEKVIADIDLNKKIKAGEAKIQVIINGLSDTASQQDYIRLRDQIEVIANELPKIKQSEGYRIAIDSIEEKQDFLIRQLGEWESRGNQPISKAQASNLRDEINLQRLRYTEESSQVRLESLLEKLKEDSIVPPDLLALAQAKLSDIRTTKNPIDCTNHYLNLTEIKLADDNASEDWQSLNQIKADGLTIIEQRISQIAKVCQQPLDEQSNNSVQLRSILSKLHGLISSHDELATLRGKLNEASQSLKEQEDNLTKRINDKKIMSSIRQYSLAKVNTLHLCEEAITEIEVKRLKINFPEDYAEEIDNQIQSLKEKASHYIQSLESLQEELSVINEPSQLTRLRDRYNKQDYIFRNSSQFAAYQQLESHINTLDEDIKVINQIQDLASVERAYNIATCDHAIAQIDHVKPTLLETERFALSIQSLKDSLIQRKQSYLSKLIEFKDGLNNAATTKEVRQVRKQINDSSNLYQGSVESQEYNSIVNEAELLIPLFQLFELQKTETSEDCALEIAKLNQWEQDNPEITPAIRSRVEAKLEDLENKRQEIQKVGRRLAESWFNRTRQKIDTVRETNEQSEKFSSSSNLIKQIKKEISKHEDLLDESEKQYLNIYLEEATAFCDEIQRLDREEKIIAQFQELPIAQRASLYERLANYLNNTEEES